MSGRAFLDTNVLIYAVAQNDLRGTRAEKLLAAGGVISVQVLNEFVSVTRRKVGMAWGEVTEALDAIRILCPLPVPITVDTHEAALRIAQEYGFGIYDALIAAAALEADCATLYSEDMRDGQVIDHRLTIRNPFHPAASV
jgi:predicted nucleic acid-binding protein